MAIEPSHEDGPVLVSVEYRVRESDYAPFTQAIHQLRAVACATARSAGASTATRAHPNASWKLRGGIVAGVSAGTGADDEIGPRDLWIGRARFIAAKGCR